MSSCGLFARTVMGWKQMWHDVKLMTSIDTHFKIRQKTGGGTAFQPVKRLDIRLFGSEAAEDNVLRRHAMPRRPWPPCPRGVGLDAFVGGSGRSAKMCPFEGQPSDRTGSDQTANRPTGPSDFEMIEMVEGKERWIWKQRLAKNKDVMLGSEPVTSRTCNNSKDVPVFVREFPSWPTWSRSMAGLEAKARSRPNCTSTDLLRSTWDHLWDHLNEMIYEIISWFSTDILYPANIRTDIRDISTCSMIKSCWYPTDFVTEIYSFVILRTFFGLGHGCRPFPRSMGYRFWHLTFCFLLFRRVEKVFCGTACSPFRSCRQKSQQEIVRPTLGTKSRLHDLWSNFRVLQPWK